MKTIISRFGDPRRCSRELVLALILFAMTPANLPAQLHTILHNFNNNPDGKSPYGNLVLSGNTLYGTAAWGGTNGNGTLFQINTDGSGFTVIRHFSSGANNAAGVFTNGDGSALGGGLLLSGGALYGTTGSGGTNGSGTVFQISTNGTGFTVIRHFAAASYYGGVWTNADGKDSSACLVLNGSTLFGTAQNGGTNGHGTVFKLNTNGSGFTVLHQFKKGAGTDGANPNAHLVLSGNTLHGTTRNGGANNCGTVFKINTNGTGFSLIWTFSTAAYDSGRRINTNSDGAIPAGGLTPSGNTLFGTTSAGACLGGGAVFKVNMDGTGFALLKNFPAPMFDSAQGNYVYGAEGWAPLGELLLSSNVLYGTTGNGGWSGTLSGLGVGSGSVFRMNTNGGDYAIIKGFSPVALDSSSNYTNSDGAHPNGNLMLRGATLYGATLHGNPAGFGTVFSVQIQPAIQSVTLASGVIGFAWSAVVGQTYQVQCADDLLSTNWINLGPAFTATNSAIVTSEVATNLQRYYRIVQP
jgi:uncharacterized repeat protein (TIGR03803 family)